MDGGLVWVPVNLRGFRINFEMNAAGFVRRREHDGQGRYLVPEPGVGQGAAPGYWLRCAGREAWLTASDVFGAFGARCEPDARWLAQTRRIVEARNRLIEQRARLRDPLGTMLQEAEGDTLLVLLNTLARGCPWERSRIRGDARGADPILGF